MHTHEQIAAMSDAEVVNQVNARAHDTIPGMSFWLDELHRRRISRANRHTMLLTAANLVVALVAALAAIVALAA
jgi:hypothetical protein